MNALALDIRAALGDDEINNITLESYDHEQISANRFILSLRSKVFREMFSDAQSDDDDDDLVMPMDYKGSVIRAMVHFCYTDEVLLKEITMNGHGGDQARQVLMEEIASLVDLLHAADFFGMKELQSKLFPVICKFMARHPFAATYVVCNVAAENAIKWNLMDVAQKIISIRPKMALTQQVLLKADQSQISKLINPLSAEGNEEWCLSLLEDWVDASASVETKERRMVAAQYVSSTLQLDNLDPQTLGSFVDRGKVVTAEAGLKAFRKQAETWKNGTPYAFVNARRISEGGDVVLVHGCGNTEVNGVYVFTEQMPDSDVGHHYVLNRTIRDTGSPTNKRECYVLEEDLAERTWYVRKGESDLLFKAPFERVHDVTKVPFDSWETEEENADCKPPLMLLIPNSLSKR